ncbi:hypothetical protein F4804DRAFT_325283 [Jackrogersella minutella]|nr:hypothetical protein F4804DRAFT_325283 [Jackrogersella minutella]
MLRLNITEAPSLANFIAPNAAFSDLTLIDLTNNDESGLDAAFANATTVDTIQTNICISLSSLQWVQSLQLFAQAGCRYSLDNLESIDEFTLTNAAVVHFTNAPPESGSLRINGSVILEHSVLPNKTDERTAVTGIWNDIDLSQVMTVGSDVNITLNSDVHIVFDNLESVGGNLVVQNNTNCTFDFNKTTAVGNLLMMDNPNTTLPLFTNLASAQNIHLRGYIDTFVSN